jgi:hypothetical protein
MMLLAALGAFSMGCASDSPQYRPQVEALALELAHTYPTTVEEVCEFASLRSHRMDFGLKGLEEEIVEMLDEGGAWYRPVLFSYLLALVESEEGFAILVDLVGDDVSDLQREGLIYCGMKFLGCAELDGPSPMTGWEVEITEWHDALKIIEDIGFHAWRLEYFQRIVRSGEPGSGDEAYAASEWLSYTLEVRDVPYLATLLEQGSPKCDMAVMKVIESLLMKKFRPDDSENALDEGIAAFRTWHEENASSQPDQWITQSFVDAGFELADLYNQTSISKVVDGLYDDSEQWVLVRSHSLAALNRICGYSVDRALIFKPEEVRREVAESFLEWYRDLAAKVKME